MYLKSEKMRQIVKSRVMKEKKRKRKNKHNKQKQEFGLKNKTYTNALIKHNLHITIEILTHEKMIGMQAMMDSGAGISAIQIKYLPHGYEIHTNTKKICASLSKYPITNSRFIWRPRH